MVPRLGCSWRRREGQVVAGALAGLMSGLPEVDALPDVPSSRSRRVPRKRRCDLHAPGRLGGTRFSHLSRCGLRRTSVRSRQLVEDMQGQASDL